MLYIRGCTDTLTHARARACLHTNAILRARTRTHTQWSATIRFDQTWLPVGYQMPITDADSTHRIHSRLLIKYTLWNLLRFLGENAESEGWVGIQTITSKPSVRVTCANKTIIGTFLSTRFNTQVLNLLLVRL